MNDEKISAQFDVYLGLLGRMVAVEERIENIREERELMRSNVNQLRARIDVLIYTAAGGLGTITILLIGLLIS